MKNVFQFIFLFSVALLVGCQASGQTSALAPTPEVNKAVIYGKLLSEDKTPMSNTIVRLAKVYRTENEEENGTFILDEANSPSTISVEDGDYYFTNIEPGEYVLFVGQLHTDYIVVSDSEQNPKVYEVGAGEILWIEPIITTFE